MADILEEIINYKKREVEQFKKECSPTVIHIQVENFVTKTPPSLKEALLASDTGIIAELKRMSPSKGWINKDCNTAQIPIDYENAGAAAVSILTDRKFFGGSHAFMTTAMKRGIHVPMLYKNFVIDEYQLFQARRYGAAAVLLIAACLTKEQCRSLISAAHSLKLEVLLELHSESELEYCDLDADVIGINNRNLGTFTTDIENSFRLAEQLPADAVKVSESGIAKPESIRRLRQAGFKGFLIGETFMSTENPGQALKQFIARL